MVVVVVPYFLLKQQDIAIGLYFGLICFNVSVGFVDFFNNLKIGSQRSIFSVIKNILRWRKESDTYLSYVCRHRWSRQITMKAPNTSTFNVICLLQRCLQASIFFYHNTFPGFPFILIFQLEKFDGFALWQGLIGELVVEL